MNRLLTCTSVMALCAGLALPVTAIAADAAPSSVGSMPTTLEGQIQRAKTLRQQGELKEAADSLRQLMLVAGSDPRVADEYGKVLAQRGYAKDAVVQLQHAVQLNGNDWTLYSALGVAYDQLDDHANARKAYDRALAMKPGDPSVLNNYAVSRMLAGDYDGAIQTLTHLKAVSSDPKIMANLEKAEELKAAHPQAKAPIAMAAATKTPPSVAVASLPPPAKSSSLVGPQKAPIDPQVASARTANAAPHTLGQASSLQIAAVAAAKADTGAKNVVMQKVPVDPMAGPVKVATSKSSAAPAKKFAAKPVDIAKAQSKHAAAKTAPPPPTSRTASD